MARKSLTVVVPVYNEEVDLPINVPKLAEYLNKNMDKYNWEIVVADNASVDKTQSVGKRLAKQKGIVYLRLPEKGRGRALKQAWGESKSDYLAYMDADLSSDLSYLPKLIGALEKGAQVAIGSRLVDGARVYGRTPFRELMSRGYSLLFRSLFFTSFKDAQCGFKAIRATFAKEVLPLIEDNEWFFDSELLIISDKAGRKITEIPIIWRDDPNSTVKVAKTAWGDIKGLLRLLVTRPWRKLK